MLKVKVAVKKASFSLARVQEGKADRRVTSCWVKSKHELRETDAHIHAASV